MECRFRHQKGVGKVGGGSSTWYTGLRLVAEEAIISKVWAGRGRSHLPAPTTRRWVEHGGHLIWSLHPENTASSVLERGSPWGRGLGAIEVKARLGSHPTKPFPQASLTHAIIRQGR